MADASIRWGRRIDEAYVEDCVQAVEATGQRQLILQAYDCALSWGHALETELLDFVGFARFVNAVEATTLLTNDDACHLFIHAARASNSGGYFDFGSWQASLCCIASLLYGAESHELAISLQRFVESHILPYKHAHQSGAAKLSLKTRESSQFVYMHWSYTDVLEALFDAYAQRGGLEFAAFVKLCKDANITPELVSQNQLGIIFSDVVEYSKSGCEALTNTRQLLHALGSVAVEGLRGADLPPRVITQIGCVEYLLETKLSADAPIGLTVELPPVDKHVRPPRPTISGVGGKSSCAITVPREGATLTIEGMYLGNLGEGLYVRMDFDGKGDASEVIHVPPEKVRPKPGGRSCEMLADVLVPALAFAPEGIEGYRADVIGVRATQIGFEVDVSNYMPFRVSVYNNAEEATSAVLQHLFALDRGQLEQDLMPTHGGFARRRTGTGLRGTLASRKQSSILGYNSALSQAAGFLNQLLPTPPVQLAATYRDRVLRKTLSPSFSEFLKQLFTTASDDKGFLTIDSFVSVELTFFPTFSPQEVSPGRVAPYDEFCDAGGQLNMTQFLSVLWRSAQLYRVHTARENNIELDDVAEVVDILNEWFIPGEADRLYRRALGFYSRGLSRPGQSPPPPAASPALDLHTTIGSLDIHPISKVDSAPLASQQPPDDATRAEGEAAARTLTVQRSRTGTLTTPLSDGTVTMTPHTTGSGGEDALGGVKSLDTTFSTATALGAPQAVNSGDLPTSGGATSPAMSAATGEPVSPMVRLPPELQQFPESAEHEPAGLYKQLLLNRLTKAMNLLANAHGGGTSQDPFANAPMESPGACPSPPQAAASFPTPAMAARVPSWSLTIQSPGPAGGSDSSHKAIKEARALLDGLAIEIHSMSDSEDELRAELLKYRELDKDEKNREALQQRLSKTSQMDAAKKSVKVLRGEIDNKTALIKKWQESAAKHGALLNNLAQWGELIYKQLSELAPPRGNKSKDAQIRVLSVSSEESLHAIRKGVDAGKVDLKMLQRLTHNVLGGQKINATDDPEGLGLLDDALLTIATDVEARIKSVTTEVIEEVNTRRSATTAHTQAALAAAEADKAHVQTQLEDSRREAATHKQNLGLARNMLETSVKERTKLAEWGRRLEAQLRRRRGLSAAGSNQAPPSPIQPMPKFTQLQFKVFDGLTPDNEPLTVDATAAESLTLDTGDPDDEPPTPRGARERYTSQIAELDTRNAELTKSLNKLRKSFVGMMPDSYTPPVVKGPAVEAGTQTDPATPWVDIMDEASGEDSPRVRITGHSPTKNRRGSGGASGMSPTGRGVRRSLSMTGSPHKKDLPPPTHPQSQMLSSPRRWSGGSPRDAVHGGSRSTPPPVPLSPAGRPGSAPGAQPHDDDDAFGGPWPDARDMTLERVGSAGVRSRGRREGSVTFTDGEQLVGIRRASGGGLGAAADLATPPASILSHRIRSYFKSILLVNAGGITWSQRPEGLVVDHVAINTPAYNAGVCSGMNLVAIDGRRVLTIEDIPTKVIATAGDLPPGMMQWEFLRMSASRTATASVNPLPNVVVYVESGPTGVLWCRKDPIGVDQIPPFKAHHGLTGMVMGANLTTSGTGPHGVYIADITDGSAAQQIGLAKGMTLAAIDGRSRLMDSDIVNLVEVDSSLAFASEWVFVQSRPSGSGTALELEPLKTWSAAGGVGKKGPGGDEVWQRDRFLRQIAEHDTTVRRDVAKWHPQLRGALEKMRDTVAAMRKIPGAMRRELERFKAEALQDLAVHMISKEISTPPTMRASFADAALNRLVEGDSVFRADDRPFAPWRRISGESHGRASPAALPAICGGTPEPDPPVAGSLFFGDSHRSQQLDDRIGYLIGKVRDVFAHQVHAFEDILARNHALASSTARALIAWIGMRVRYRRMRKRAAPAAALQAAREAVDASRAKRKHLRQEQRDVLAKLEALFYSHTTASLLLMPSAQGGMRFRDLAGNSDRGSIACSPTTVLFPERERAESSFSHRSSRTASPMPSPRAHAGSPYSPRRGGGREVHFRNSLEANFGEVVSGIAALRDWVSPGTVRRHTATYKARIAELEMQVERLTRLLYGMRPIGPADTPAPGKRTQPTVISPPGAAGGELSNALVLSPVPPPSPVPDLGGGAQDVARRLLSSPFQLPDADEAWRFRETAGEEDGMAVTAKGLSGPLAILSPSRTSPLEHDPIGLVRALNRDRQRREHADRSRPFTAVRQRLVLDGSPLPADAAASAALPRPRGESLAKTYRTTVSPRHRQPTKVGGGASAAVSSPGALAADYGRDSGTLPLPLIPAHATPQDVMDIMTGTGTTGAGRGFRGSSRRLSTGARAPVRTTTTGVAMNAPPPSGASTIRHAAPSAPKTKSGSAAAAAAAYKSIQTHPHPQPPKGGAAKTEHLQRLIRTHRDNRRGVGLPQTR